MKNKIAGIIIIGVALIIGFITYSFNKALTNIINTACSHGSECAMWGTLKVQTDISIGLMVFVILIGLYLIFFGKEERIITRIEKVKEQIDPEKVTKENYKEVLEKLSNDEKEILEVIIEAKGSIYQSKIVEETDMTKVKVTRILDKLEGRKIIERKRRGMTNIVILKQ
jgi:uncharacterized membrane protein